MQSLFPIGFATLGTALAAFAIWLAVRLVNRPATHVGRLWVGVALVTVLVLYPLSAGPVAWLAGRDAVPEYAQNAVGLFFWPLEWVIENTPEWMMGPYLMYLWWCSGIKC